MARLLRRCEWTLFMISACTLVIYSLWVAYSFVTPAPYSCVGLTCKRCINGTASHDDPLALLDLRLGRWDTSRGFRTFDNAAVGALYSEISDKNRVCLATQTSIENLHELLKTAAHWSGPMSIAVYVAGDEMIYFRGYITWLINCQPAVFSRMAFHVVTPKARPAELSVLPPWARQCDDLPKPTNERSEETTSWRAKNPYPQNVLRNLARKNTQTSYVYLVDADIVPCMGMAESLEKFLSNSTCSKCAFVIPTYELDWSAEFPRNKSQLIQYKKQKLAVAYHSKVFKPNQQSSDLHKWEARTNNETQETHVSYDVTNYRMLYEPFYVAHDKVPPHDERFIGYGSTRNSQVYEMYVSGYQFKVLSPIFTIHWGLQSKDRPKWRMRQIYNNYKKFEVFKKEVYARYGKDPMHFFTEEEKKKDDKKS